MEKCNNPANIEVREEGGEGIHQMPEQLFSAACRSFGKDHSRTGILEMDPVAMRGFCWNSYHIAVQEGPHIAAGCYAQPCIAQTGIVSPARN